MLYNLRNSEIFTTLFRFHIGKRRFNIRNVVKYDKNIEFYNITYFK